jgi:hemoglobin
MDNLYDQIGPERLQLLVERFYDRVFSSPLISELFRTDKATIMTKQTAFLTQFLGGPQFYTAQFGHPRMRIRHLPHRITVEASYEWLRCMNEAIATLDLPDDVKTRLYNCFPPLAQHMVNA